MLMMMNKLNFSKLTDTESGVIATVDMWRQTDEQYMVNENLIFKTLCYRKVIKIIYYNLYIKMVF